MKKLIVILFFLMVFISSLNAIKVGIDGLAYSLDETTQTASVIGRNGGVNDVPPYSGDIVIPETIEYEGVTYTVTSVEGGFAYNDDILSVTIPGTVTSIGDYAFLHCYDLETVNIPKSVTSIGKYAFWGTKIKSIDIPNLSVINEGVFGECKNLSSVILSEGLEEIGYIAFVRCYSLTSISIPETVTTIGAEAFYSDTSLVSVDLPENVKIINKGAFENCTKLSSIKLPGALEVIYDNAFYNCPLTTIEIPEKLTYIGKSAFYNCPLTTTTTLVFPEKLTRIGESAFEKCAALRSVSFHGNLTEVGAKAFGECRLENVMTCSPYPRRCESFPQAFSDRTFMHATLYVPAGQLMEYVYNSQWYLFNNIRETAMTTSELSLTKAFKMMDAGTFGFAVYDPVNNETRMTESKSLDETNPDNCWQIVEKDGGRCLYNIGARKYAVFRPDGSMILTDVPTVLEMRDTDKGIAIGEDTRGAWYFVLNDNVMVDKSVTSVKEVSAMDAPPMDYYSTDGRHIQLPGKGITIIRMRDGSVRKVIK